MTLLADFCNLLPFTFCTAAWCWLLLPKPKHTVSRLLQCLSLLFFMYSTDAAWCFLLFFMISTCCWLMLTATTIYCCLPEFLIVYCYLFIHVRSQYSKGHHETSQEARRYEVQRYNRGWMRQLSEIGRKVGGFAYQVSSVFIYCRLLYFLFLFLCMTVDWCYMLGAAAPPHRRLRRLLVFVFDWYSCCPADFCFLYVSQYTIQRCLTLPDAVWTILHWS